MWVVELNLPGYRIRRWAEKRRHLIAPNLRSFAPRVFQPVESTRAAS